MTDSNDRRQQIVVLSMMCDRCGEMTTVPVTDGRQTYVPECRCGSRSFTVNPTEN